MRPCRGVVVASLVALCASSCTRPVRAEGALGELTPELRTRASPPPTAPVPLSGSTPRPWRFEVGVAVDVGYGRTPTVTVGPSLLGAVVPPGFVPLLVRASAYPFGSPRSTIPGEGVTIRSVEGGVDVCPIDLGQGSYGVRACGGAHVAALFATPRGPLSTDARRIFPTFPLRAELRRWFGPVAPFVAIQGWLSPTTPSFLYRDAAGDVRTSFRVALITGSAELGVVVRIGP